MKIVITPDGQKRYRFEDSDLAAQREFERAVAGGDKTLSKLVADLLGEMQQRFHEAWRHATDAIKEIDPEVSGSIGYDFINREFRVIEKGDVPAPAHGADRNET